MATCPACDAEMDVDEFDVDRGDRVSCPECGSNLEVVQLSPVELEVYAEDEDDATELDGANFDGSRSSDDGDDADADDDEEWHD